MDTFSAYLIAAVFRGIGVGGNQKMSFCGNATIFKRNIRSSGQCDPDSDAAEQDEIGGRR
jgi:hypothetical protein